MGRYRAKNLLFIDSKLIAIGEEFESELVPGRNWEPLDDDAKAAVAKSFPSGVPQDRLPARSAPLASIPDNWRDLPVMEVIMLARTLGAPVKGTKHQQAIEFIDRELAQRAQSSNERAAA